MKISSPHHCACIKPLVYWQNDSLPESVSVGKHYQACKKCLLTCFTSPKYNPGKPTHTGSWHFKLVSGQFKVRQTDAMQPPVWILVAVCIFSYWVEAFPADRLLTLLWLKSFLRRSPLPSECLLNILLAGYLHKPELFGPFYTLSLCSPSSVLGLFEHTNGILKIQLKAQNL